MQNRLNSKELENIELLQYLLEIIHWTSEYTVKGMEKDCSFLTFYVIPVPIQHDVVYRR